MYELENEIEKTAERAEEQLNAAVLLEEHYKLTENSKAGTLVRNEPEALSFNTDELYCSVLNDGMELTGRPLQRPLDDGQLLRQVIGPNARMDVLGGGALSSGTLANIREYLYQRPCPEWQHGGMRAGWLQDQLGSGFRVQVTPPGNQHISQEGVTIYYQDRQVGRLLRHR